MKERPIIFNDEMVRAIIDGRKTQTRRPVNFPLIGKISGGVRRVWTERKIPEINERLAAKRAKYVHHRVPSPYGQPGDRLWVREAFAMVDDRGIHIWTNPLVGAPANYAPVYRTDHDARSACLPGGWRPSNHMPRWASRITLEIVAVRVERVQDISEADARAEGVSGHFSWTHRMAFEYLWDGIYGGTDYAWTINPWVWAIEFRMVEA